MNAAPFDHPYLSGLLGDNEVTELLSAEADLAAMVAFEAALSEAEGAEGIIPETAAAAIAAALEGVEFDMQGLHEGTTRDGVVVPALVAQLRAAVGGEAAGYVHFGATSQDVVDTSLALRLKQILDLFVIRLYQLAELLREIEHRDGEIETMAHTRMQAAIAVPAVRKIRSWREPLERHRARLQPVIEHVCVLHFGGAAGTLDKLGDRAWPVTHRMAQKLELRVVDHARHSERDAQAELASWLSLLTGTLGKMGQDIALMAQNEVGEVKLSTGGGSSAMPHKSNPVGAEVLVALARFNATLLAGMHQSLVHENERSGAAWTLEWMLLPQMVMSAAAALRTADALLRDLTFASSDRAEA